MRQVEWRKAKATHYVRWLWSVVEPPYGAALEETLVWELTQTSRQVCADPVFGPGDLFVRAKHLPDPVLSQAGFGLIASRADVVREHGWDVWSIPDKRGMLYNTRPSGERKLDAYYRKRSRRYQWGEAWLRRGWGARCQGLVYRVPPGMSRPDARRVKEFALELASSVGLKAYNWWELFQGDLKEVRQM